MREETKGARNPNAQKSQCSGYSNKGQLSNSYIPEVGTVLEEAAKANLLRECVLELSLQPSTAVSELLASTGEGLTTGTGVLGAHQCLDLSL